MKIKSFEFDDPSPEGWSLSKLVLNEHTNLFVGASGAGKTRVLNMLHNIATFAASDARFCNGRWTWAFEQQGKNYVWTYHGNVDEGGTPRVLSERLVVISPDNQERVLFERNETSLTVLNKESPKLSRRCTAIYLLREEDEIQPVHRAFKAVMRRNFFGGDLVDAVAFQSLPAKLIRTLNKKASLNELEQQPLTLPARLAVLQRYFKDEYEVICEQFKRVFPWIISISIGKASDTIELPVTGDIPVVLFQEKGSNAHTPLQEISSGMQKVILIITDIVTGPTDMLYMIDEYENSLGINAIDFLPPFLAECGRNRQFILTSHHPVLINAIPVNEWFVFHRKGTAITVKHGQELENKYGKSKQQKFVQLLNDPFYTEGVE